MLLRSARRRRWLAGGFLAAALALPAAWLAGRQVEAWGLGLYEAGRAAVVCLGELARPFAARDAGGIEAAFAPGCSGRDLVFGEPGTELEVDSLHDVLSRQDLSQTDLLFDPDRRDGVGARLTLEAGG